MAGFELEEGEAYFAEGGDDDNIDPDKDFSYIDKKIENVLGQYQKDFMGGVSADVLGARYGGYGSFLPMHQRSPPVLSNQRLPSHISSESPRDPPSEHPRQKPVAVANHSLPMKSGPASSDLGVRTVPETGMCSMSNQSKLQSSHEGSSNDEQKKPVVHHTAQKPLKVRVKMPSESAFSRGNSSIYSGLGLEMSPCSSPEESSSEYDGTSPDTQEMKLESPTYIVKIMTSFPLHKKEILSPLHHSLVCLSGPEKNLQAVPLGCAEPIPQEGKSKVNKDRKSNKVKHPTKDRKSKQKESNKESKSEKKLCAKPVEVVKESHEYPADAVVLSSKKREESATLLAKGATQSKASTNAVDAYFGETGLAAMTARDNAKGKSVATSSQDAPVMDEGNVKPSRAKFQKERTLSFVLRKGSREDQGNEVRLKEEEAAGNLLKQQGPTKYRVKNVVLRAGFPTGDGGVSGKESGIQKKALEDQQVGSTVPIKTVEEKGKHDPIVEKVKTSKQKPGSKSMPHAQVGVGVSGGKEHPSLSKKKSRKSQINSAPSTGLPRGDLMDGSLAAENEEAILGSNIPFKSKRDGNDLQREVRKDGDLPGNVNPGKKGKDPSIKGSIMGVSDREAVSLAGKLKSSSKNAGGDTNLGPNLGGHLSGTNLVAEKLPGVGDVVPMDMENWVLCEKCEKWRLLPLGTNPDFLPKEWTCSMITWLPGKNSCSISEDETTNGLRALYQGQVVGLPAQNPPPAYPHGTAFAPPSAGVPHNDIFGGGGKKNLFKTQMNVPRQSGGLQEHIPVKKEQQHSGEVKGSKHPKRLAGELDTVGTPGDHNAPKLEKVAEFSASGASKKLKREDRQSVENLGLGMSTVESRKDGSGAQRIANDFAKRSSESPLAKAKGETRKPMTARTPETSQKKRKLKDQLSAEEHSAEHRNEKKLKVSNIQQREYSASQKADGRKSSEKGLGLGASDNATTSSSSKISRKVKAEVKCSPAGSISSSSPFTFSKSHHGDAVERSPAKQLKLKTPQKEETRDRKSNLSRSSGAVSDAVGPVVKISVGRHPDVNGVDKPKLKGHKDTSVKLNHVTTSQQKPVSETEKAYGSNASGRSDNFNAKPQPTGHVLKAIEASSSMKKDVFPWDANVALKEATDRLKISGSGLESTEALFEAALKFLHGASLLDPGSNEGGKCGEMTQTAAYSTTAKLCEHCAHEYERCDNMASAALAYKCMEVAYLRIVYSNDVAASRDRAELDMAVRAAPQVESPSSSASDIDSLNNQAVGEMLKDGNPVLDQRNHVISARSRPNFLRLLNFTQQVNMAMEAARRSQSALEAAEPALTQAGKGETIGFIKRVLDFSFHDIGGFLHLVKLAMDAFTT